MGNEWFLKMTQNVYIVIVSIPAHKVGERPPIPTYEFKEHRGFY